MDLVNSVVSGTGYPTLAGCAQSHYVANTDFRLGVLPTVNEDTHAVGTRER